MLVAAADMTQASARVPSADWDQFVDLHGRDGSAVIRGFISWQLGRPGAAAPTRPPAGTIPPVTLPPDVLAQLTAWYLRQPGAELPRRPGGETAPKVFLVSRGDWDEFRRRHGGKASEVIKMFIAWTLHRPGAQLPPRLEH